VHAALLAAGYWILRRTPKSNRLRGFFYNMGVCCDCLVTINGTPNQRACLTLVQSHMEIEIDESIVSRHYCGQRFGEEGYRRPALQARPSDSGGGQQCPYRRATGEWIWHPERHQTGHPVPHGPLSGKNMRPPSFGFDPYPLCSKPDGCFFFTSTCLNRLHKNIYNHK
jgi:hypothetical protein